MIQTIINWAFAYTLIGMLILYLLTTAMSYANEDADATRDAMVKRWHIAIWLWPLWLVALILGVVRALRK